MYQLLESVFSGQYLYKRKISSPRLCLEGMACFEKKSCNKIMYEERGSYMLDEIEQTCYQKQIFRMTPSNLYIYKNDLTLLHEFLLDSTAEVPVKLTHMHLCKNDQYALEILIYSSNNFSTSYRVQGSSKNYRIHTIFKRRGY